MRLVCLNAWGGVLHGALLEWLARVQPDMLCLQEVVHTPDAQSDWLTYRDGDHVLPQRANLFSEVARVLPGHTATFCPAARGTLWDGALPVPSFWGLATYVHAALPVVAQAQGFVHKGFSADGFGDHPRSRTAHAVRVHDLKQSRAVSIAQMHGLRDLAGKHDTPARAAQVRRFLALSDGVSDPGDLRILCGDFNVEPVSATLAFLRDQGFEDMVTTRGFAGTRTQRYTKPGRFADYLLVNRPEAVRHFDVVREPEVSDHCPLVLEI